MRTPRNSRHILPGTVAALALIAGAIMAPPATAAPPAPAANTSPKPVDDQVRAAAKPAPKKAVVSFTVGLKRPDSAAKQLLAEVSDPTSPMYRQFPNRNEVASWFGADTKSLQALRASAGAYGLKVSLDRTGVFATVKGRAGAMGRWLGKPIKYSEHTEDGMAMVAYQGPKRLPKSLRNKVREFIPKDMISRAAPGSLKASSLPPYQGINEGTPEGCLSPEGNKYIYSYNQLRTAYGIADLPDAKKIARATRVVIMAEGDGFSKGALKASSKCFKVPTSQFTRKRTPGLKSKLPVGDEGQLDVQVVQSVLPAGSRVKVVEQSTFDGRWYLSWATAFGLKQQPDVITTSYGLCEQQTGSLFGFSRSLMEAVATRLGLIGTSAFSAAGDQGSSDCVVNNGSGEGNKALAVDYPGSSPFVTSVGGTRIILDESNGRTGEWVWNATAALPPVGPSLGGGGGGDSRWFKRPWWQAKSTTDSRTRTVPDVAAHAAGGPAWPLFMSGGDNPEFTAVGGTSAATPMTAASVGIIAAVQRTKGRPPLGPVQPWLYRMQQRNPKAFYDVVDGNNDVYNQGCCSAKVGYDKASGLGSPNFDVWLRKLPAAGTGSSHGRNGLG